MTWPARWERMAIPLLHDIRMGLILIREGLSQPSSGKHAAGWLLSLEQVASVLSVCPRTVEALVTAGDLISIRSPFKPESVEA